VSWTAETIKRFEQAYRKVGFRSRAHFFDQAGMTFIKQVEAGEKLIWPIRLETEKPPPAKNRRRYSKPK
jgi:hypothetical protein